MRIPSDSASTDQREHAGGPVPLRALFVAFLKVSLYGVGGGGGLAAVAGFLLIPWTIGFTLGVTLLQYAHLPVLRNILVGLSAAAAGLLIATGIRMLMPHRGRAAALIFAGLAFGLMVVVKLPLLVALFGLLPLSIGVAGVQHARAR